MRRIQKYYTDFANSLFATKFLDSESSPFLPSKNTMLLFSTFSDLSFSNYLTIVRKTKKFPAEVLFLFAIPGSYLRLESFFTTTRNKSFTSLLLARITSCGFRDGFH